MSTYSDTVLQDNPALYWRLGETSGTNAADGSGHSRVGTYRAAATLNQASLLTGDADPCISNATTGPGANRLVTDAAFGGNPNGLATAGYSMEIWFIFNTSDTTQRMPLALAGLNPWMDINTATAGLFRYGHRDLISNFAFIQTTGLSTATVYHAVGTYDKTNLRLYLNGALVAGPTAAGLPANNVAYTGQVTVGGNPDGSGGFWDGKLDEAAFYLAPLSAGRIAQHYSAGKGRIKPRLRNALNVPVSTPSGGVYP